MPELPEVEIARRNLLRWLEGRRVVGAQADATRIFRGADRARFERLGGRLESLSRKGKYLLFHFEGDQGLLAHLGMAGKFVRRTTEAPEPYSRARLFLDSGDIIHYRDPRLFGRLEPTPARQLTRLAVIEALGRDPLVEGLSGAQLRASIGRTRQPLKVALMDQSRVAGLGNLHAAEALFRARLHPARLPESLVSAEWTRLARAIQAGLAFALETQEQEEVAYLEDAGGSEDNPFFVYGRRGEKCRRCRSPIAFFTQGGRTTYLCRRCQPKHPARVDSRRRRAARR